MEDHLAKALGHLDAALEGEGPSVEMEAAKVHAILHLAETVRLGIRDLVYEIRD